LCQERKREREGKSENGVCGGKRTAPHGYYLLEKVARKYDVADDGHGAEGGHESRRRIGVCEKVARLADRHEGHSKPPDRERGVWFLATLRGIARAPVSRVAVTRQGKGGREDGGIGRRGNHR